MDVIQLILDLTRDVDSEAEDKQDKIDSFLNHTNSEGKLSSDDLPYLFEWLAQNCEYKIKSVNFSIN